MSPQTAKTIVLASSGLMLVLVAADRTSTGTKVRRLWPVAAVTVGLSLLADVAPEVAGPAALLVLLAVAARQKGVLGGILGGVASESKTVTGK